MHVKKRCRTSHPKTRRCGILPSHLCQFELIPGDWICRYTQAELLYSGKADAGLFSFKNQFLSIFPESCSVGSLSKHQTHRETRLLSFPFSTSHWPFYPPLTASSSSPPYSFRLFSLSGESHFLASFPNRIVENGIWWKKSCFSNEINVEVLTFSICIRKFVPWKWLTIYFLMQDAVT